MKVFKDKAATYADLEALPETLVGELIGGELSTSPRPGPPHLFAAYAVGAQLGHPYQFGSGGPGGWWFAQEPELHLGEDVLVPDLAGWRRERLSQLPSAAYFTTAPDWVCEVLSPSTAGFDRVRKMPLYLRSGVGHIWLVDPLAKTVEAFHAEAGRWILSGQYAGDSTARIPPFIEFELDLKKLWPFPRDPEPSTP